jgi:hypothetical protein
LNIETKEQYENEPSFHEANGVAQVSKSAVSPISKSASGATSRVAQVCPAERDATQQAWKFAQQFKGQSENSSENARPLSPCYGEASRHPLYRRAASQGTRHEKNKPVAGNHHPTV